MIYVNRVSVSWDEIFIRKIITLTKNASAFGYATVYPANATKKSVCWKSSDKKVARVNENTGLVVAQGPGTATITATACDGICYYHRPYYAVFVQQALHYKGEGAYCHHKECGQGNAVGIACAYGGYCLWQVTQYHANAGNVPANGVYCFLVHGVFYLKNIAIKGNV